jgi:acetyl esterase/lipase
MRGHGESREAGDRRLDHEKFTDADHQAKAIDVEAAVEWMVMKRGARRARLALVGASIGANLAIGYAALHKEIPAVVALSPGLDYRGVTTIDKVALLGGEQKLMLAASTEDEFSSLPACRELAARKKDVVLREVSGLGHGTTMLDRDPPLLSEVVAWLTSNVS